MYAWMTKEQLCELEKELTKKARDAPRNKPEAPSNAWARFSYELGTVRMEIDKRSRS